MQAVEQEGGQDSMFLFRKKSGRKLGEREEINKRSQRRKSGKLGDYKEGKKGR